MALLYKGLIIKVTLDINGNVWAVGPNTIYCFRPNGQMTRKITAAEQKVRRENGGKINDTDV